LLSGTCCSTGCSRKVERDGEAILLQPREFRLLEYLMKNAGKVVTRTMLLENVWDYHFDPQTNVIDVHMSPAARQDRQGLCQPAAAHDPWRRLYDPGVADAPARRSLAHDDSAPYGAVHAVFCRIRRAAAG